MKVSLQIFYFDIKKQIQKQKGFNEYKSQNDEIKGFPALMMQVLKIK